MSRPATPPHPSKGEQTRAGIVDCALRLFYAHGYEGTSFSDIVEASGLYRGNIYHYFKTKDDILKAVIARHLDHFSALLELWLRQHDSPKARILAFLDMITGRSQELVQYGCPIGSLNTELGKDRCELQAAARTLFDLFRDWLAARFVELGHAEQAQALALHLLGRAQGIALMAHVYHDEVLLQRETGMLRGWVESLSEGR